MKSAFTPLIKSFSWPRTLQTVGPFDTTVLVDASATSILYSKRWTAHWYTRPPHVFGISYFCPAHADFHNNQWAQGCRWPVDMGCKGHSSLNSFTFGVWFPIASRLFWLKCQSTLRAGNRNGGEADLPKCPILTSDRPKPSRGYYV
jgi:hypothetical protein